MIWYAVQTPPQRERACAELLNQRGWVTHIPMRTARIIVRQRPRKVATREFPIIPSLLFVEMPWSLTADPYLWWQLAQVRLVRSIVGNGDVPYGIPAEQIERMVKRNGELDALKATRARTARSQFAKGQRVVFKDGPLAGFSGPVTGISGERYRLMLEMLGSVREVEANGADLDAA